MDILPLLWRLAFCDRYGISAGHLVRPLASIIPVLLAKTADMNPRIKQTATDLILILAKRFHAPPLSVVTVVVGQKPLKVIQNYRHAKARVDLVRTLITELGVAGSAKASDENDGVDISVEVGICLQIRFASY